MMMFNYFMKKFFKISKLIILNVLIFLLLLFLSDLIVFSIFVKPIQNKQNPTKFTYNLKNPYIHFIYLKDYFNGKNNTWYGRKPDGLEYKDKTPVILFGGSFAYGQYLNYNQTFSYKLSQLLKRPVYNRGIPAGGFQHMYYQTLSEQFYKDVPPSDTVFFVLIDDHYKRMLKSSINIADDYLYLQYSYKNNKLIMHNYNNPLFNFLKSCYTFRLFYYPYVDAMVNNSRNEDKITDMALAYFVNSRNELEKRFNKKINFVVIFYTSWSYRKTLESKLRLNNFKVIDTREITNEDLRSSKYFMQDSLHPSQEAWDLLTPLIVEELSKY